MSDFDAGINAAKSAIDFMEYRANFSNAKELISTLQSLDRENFDVIALVRGGGARIESLDDVSPALPALKYATKILKKSSLLTTTGRSTKEILTDIRRLNNSLDKPAFLSDETFMGNALLLYAELCFSLNLDGELLLHNAVTKFKNSLQSSENHLNNPASTD